MNLEIDVDGDRATDACDFMFWAKDKEGKAALMFLGRYADALVRAERRVAVRPPGDHLLLTRAGRPPRPVPGAGPRGSD